MLDREQIIEVLGLLQERYPDAGCELNHRTPFELLVATILSAQSTDKRVNIVTEDLFKEYDTPEKMLKLSEDQLSEKIKTIGFHRTKSRNILGAARIICEQFGSKVPDSREELEKLPGVGRKTASVVLSNAFNQNAIAVDTHVFRVSNRIGLAHSDNVVGTEKDLMENIDEQMWSHAHHLLIFHGRRTCKARNPLCEECNLRSLCEYYKEYSKSN